MLNILMYRSFSATSKFIASSINQISIYQIYQYIAPFLPPKNVVKEFLHQTCVEYFFCHVTFHHIISHDHIEFMGALLSVLSYIAHHVILQQHFWHETTN